MKKVYLNVEEFDRLLGRKPLTQFVEEIQNNGYKCSYSNFYNLYRGYNNWTGILMLGVAETLGVSVEQLFHIHYVDK